MKEKITISLKELRKTIKEEYENIAAKIGKASDIEKRIHKINEELENLQGDTELEEVEAGGLKTIKSAGWTEDGDKKYDEKFEKVGSHLKEDEEDEMEMKGEFETKFAELGKAIDQKLTGAPEEKMDDMDNVGDMGDMDNVGDEVSTDEFNIEDKVEDDMNGEETEDEEEKEMKESVDEPLEGHSVAQDGEKKKVEDYMEKDTHVHESKEVKKHSLLSEGLEDKRSEKLTKELQKMRRLANLDDNEEK